MDSILNSIKKLLGISDDYTHFDTDIILHINSALSVLVQLGVGPSDGFSISDATSTWNDFIGDLSNLDLIKTYVYIKVRLVFDPPVASAVLESMKRMADEYEWRINVEAEKTREGPT